MTLSKTDLPESTLLKNPQIHTSVFIASGARVMGDVRIGAHSSIWYNAVARGDINSIIIGENTNIQDGCILHVENFRKCIVGDSVTVGHHVNLHACTVEDGCLIGIGAVILSGAHIKTGSIIAAGAVVREDTVVEPYSLMAGVPARLVRTLPEDTLATNLKWAEKYEKLAALHRKRYGSEKCLVFEQ